MADVSSVSMNEFESEDCEEDSGITSSDANPPYMAAVLFQSDMARYHLSEETPLMMLEHAHYFMQPLAKQEMRYARASSQDDPTSYNILFERLKEVDECIPPPSLFVRVHPFKVLNVLVLPAQL